MSVAMCLLLYSVLALTAGPLALTRLTRGGDAPGLGVSVWLAAMLSVLGSWISATIFLATDVVHTGWTGVAMWRACLAVVRNVAAGGYGFLVQAIALAIVAAAVFGLGRLGWRVQCALSRADRQAAEHAHAARIVGRRYPGLDAVVLDGRTPAAYCVADPTRTTIVTTGALQVLDSAQLDAVLTHERAHLDEHHHLLIALTRGLATALPGLALFTRGAAEIARLLEMRADDAAVRAHGRQTLLEAFAALTAGSGVPAAALAATGGDMLSRVQRLMSPPRGRRLPLAVCSRLVVTGVLITGPIAVATVTAMNSGLCSFAAL
ncbi:M56 family metallopeptidase [Mycolicibacter arupensis]|uniref:Peptidase M48 domain-containing protein n=1 Tax=Mycolicibacter arupensis TaxID=342002 RepID=A0A0F5MTJ1_9MYCO|nr:M56 family metallopeptidase [Mycolicibacter arupensis]KKB97347.1 hypothetical protein WR43_19545 [Mycolicibacter arupensis]MCV7275592.1 M56 family metallopeptidase [Mycolicibacter arupensis]OQZ90708.1 hypothetical protein BST15_20550 [Mycolicibacter arupensis]